MTWAIAFSLTVAMIFGAYYGLRDDLPPPVTPMPTPAAVLGPPASLQEPTPVPTPVLPSPDALPYVDSDGWDLCVVDWECWQAAVIQSCENPHGDPSLVSLTGDYGIMQIHAETWRYWLDERGFDFWDEWDNAQRNIEMAYAIWQEYSWWEWVCAR